MHTAMQIKIASENITQMLDGLPILATIIGTRTDDHEAGPSSEADEELMNALFKVHETWQEVKPK